VEENQVTQVIEEKIGAGLIEEVLIQAGEELELMKQLAVQKPWKELQEEPLPDQWKYFDKE
jgi:NADH dehydrogenase (ubiquinone) 1 alpha subcomplex subunit 5